MIKPLIAVMGQFGPHSDSLTFTAHKTCDLLERLGYPLRRINFTKNDSRRAPPLENDLNGVRIALNLVNAGYQRLNWQITQSPAFNRVPIRISRWFWETETPPPYFLTLAKSYTEIWASCTYLERVFAAAFDTPVRLVYQPMEWKPQTTHLVDPCLTQFIYVFNTYSNQERKNPWGVTNAFSHAFPGHHSDDHYRQLYGKVPRLTIKTYNARPSIIARFKHTLGIHRNSRIQLHSEFWTESQMTDFYSRADVFVSPHRSEGLGLFLLEALRESKILLSTGYGGVTEDIPLNCYNPVKWKWVPAAHVYYKGNNWADINSTELAEIMIQVMKEPIFFRETTSLGHQWFTDTFNDTMISAQHAEALEELLSKPTSL